MRPVPCVGSPQNKPLESPGNSSVVPPMHPGGCIRDIYLAVDGAGSLSPYKPPSKGLPLCPKSGGRAPSSLAKRPLAPKPIGSCPRQLRDSIAIESAKRASGSTGTERRRADSIRPNGRKSCFSSATFVATCQKGEGEGRIGGTEGGNNGGEAGGEKSEASGAQKRGDEAAETVEGQGGRKTPGR